jgi:hypothetical protein
VTNCAVPGRLALILEKLVRSTRSVVGRLVGSLDVFVSFGEGKGATLLSLDAEDIEGFSTAIAIFNSSFLAEDEGIGKPLSAL